MKRFPVHSLFVVAVLVCSVTLLVGAGTHVSAEGAPPVAPQSADTAGQPSVSSPGSAASMADGLSLAQSEDAPKPGQIATYTNSRYGYQFDYAVPWTLTYAGESGAGHATRLINATEVAADIQQFNVVVRNLAPYASLEEWLAAEQEVTLREPSAMRTVVLDGISGIEKTFTDGEVSWIAQYYLQWDKVYLLNYGPIYPDARNRVSVETIGASLAWATEARHEPVPELPPGDHVGDPSPLSPNSPTGKPALQFPFCGQWRISGGYYSQSPGHANDQYNKFALDWVATDGVVMNKPIYAAHSGTVSTGWDSYGGGWLAKLTYDGDATYKSWYAHLSNFTVTSGFVPAGAEIARAGNSGIVTGPHLHFALLQNNIGVKPEPMSGVTGFGPGQTHNRNCGGSFQCSDVLPVGEGSSRKQLFIDAYYRMGGRAKLGCTRGGAYWWVGTGGQSIVRQDFTGNDGSNAVMITHNEAKDSPSGSVPAYVTWGGLYSRYIALGGINAAGSVGIPTSDEYKNSANQPQSSFTHGYITWDGDSFEFTNWPGYNASQWQVKYFNGRNQDHNREPTWRMNLNTTHINLDWATGSPGNGRWGVWADNYSMTAVKQVAFEAGRYNFHVQADDGVKLWVDSTLLINEWHSAPGNHYNAEINLTQGTHLIVLAYYEEAGEALVKLDWAKVNPPAAPSLNTISNADGDGNYSVSWSTISGVSGYRLQEQFNGGSFGDAYVGSATSTARSGRGVGQWCYRVMAWNSAGSSPWSSTRCTTVNPAVSKTFLSPLGNGNVNGLAFTGSDILRYDKAANSWTMVYDGSALGTPKKLNAFQLLSNGSLLLVFAVNQPIAGLGTATPFDVVRFTPNTPHVFPLGPGTFSWYFQGKPKGLTTSGEKIDALAQVGSQIMFSTVGTAKVPLANGAVLTAQDEDVFAYSLANDQWLSSLTIDGSLIPGMAAEDINGLWDDQYLGDFYVSILGAFNLGGVRGNGKSIVKLTQTGGASVFTPSLVTWLAPGAKFPSTLGGIDMGQ